MALSTETSTRAPSGVNMVINNLSKLRQKLSELQLRMIHEGTNCDWQHYLSLFALCASELAETRKLLHSDKTNDILKQCIIPKLLSPEEDSELAKLTERRISMFTYDVVPNYLNTKLSLGMEGVKANLLNRAAGLKNLETTETSTYHHTCSPLFEKVSHEINALMNSLEDDWNSAQHTATSSKEQRSNNEQTRKFLTFMHTGKTTK